MILRLPSSQRTEEGAEGTMDRRAFLARAVSVATPALFGLPADRVAAEVPPETTRIRLAKYPAICSGPQFIAEQLLRAEGFSDTQYLTRPGMGWSVQALAAGEIDVAVGYATNTIIQIDAGEPVVLLGGIHVGC